MADDRTDEILKRLESIEARLNDLSIRVHNAEAAKPPQVIPPPVRIPDRSYAAPYQARQMPQYAPPPWPPATPPSKPKPAKAAPNNDAEYVIGAKILPKVGALLMLLALTLLVVLAYSRGLITPAMMFGLEVAFCGAFVVTGIVKRDMKEEYGQILTGIGSCGLYLVFAGGNFYYRLYDGQTLLTLCSLLSQANLAYSYWRSSRSFLIVGLIGGLLTASVLPNLLTDHSALNAWIHFFILVPAALVVAKNRWMGMAVGLWAAATIALIPILSYGLPWPDKVAILYASTAVCMSAYASSYRQWEFDPKNLALPGMLWFAGLIGLLVAHGGLVTSVYGWWWSPDMRGAIGCLQFAGFFALFSILSYVWREKPLVSRGFAIGAVGVPITLAPLCFPQVPATEMYAGLSIVAALISWKPIMKLAAIAAATEFVLAALVYVQVDWTANTWRTESLILLLLMVSLGLIARASSRAYANGESSVVAASAIVLPFFARLSVLVLGRDPVSQPGEFALTLSLLLFSYYALVLYSKTQWKSVVVAFCLLFGASLWSYVAAASLPVTRPSELLLLIPLMAVPLAGLRVMPRLNGELDGAMAATIFGALFTRLAVILLSWLLLWPQAIGAIVGALAYAFACFVILANRKRVPFAVGGWALLIFAAAAYIASPPLALPVDSLVSLGLLATLILGGRQSASLIDSKREYRVFLALAGWAAFSRFSWALVMLYMPSIGSSPAISVGWTVYAFALLALGFAYRAIEFRYVSFVVMAATVVKVLFVDLATTDKMLRVGIVMGLAIVLLAAGYWYARSQEAGARSHRFPS